MKKAGTRIKPHTPLWGALRCPGLTGASSRLQQLSAEVRSELAVYVHKQSQPEELLWVVFLGGTGTGKSTLFNALCGATVSATGVERPKTGGPIIYLHRLWAEGVADYFPSPSLTILRAPTATLAAQACTGNPDQVIIHEHERASLSHLVLVDTPDLDSLEKCNRQMAEDLYLFADAVLFVSSQEKYADQVPYAFLKRVHHDGKLCFLLINKAEPVLQRPEVLVTLQEQHLSIAEDRFFLLPYTSREPAEFLRNQADFQAFAELFKKTLAKAEAPHWLQAERKRSARSISTKIQLILGILQDEQHATHEWLEVLENLFQAACRNLLETQYRNVTEDSRRYLQAEIRRAFGKYDLLAKPRRFIRQLLLTPLQLLGWRRSEAKDPYHAALQLLHQKMDLTPVQMAVEAFNRQVLETLEPVDGSAPLLLKLREPQVLLSDAEIKNRTWQEQEGLVLWLEETLQNLARGIPKSKEWGIYSTSIAWGMLILLLETVVGGGISLTEAVLDSALAPFVTKGAVELFAYSELQKIARELAERYQNGLFAVVREQRDRYAQILREMAAPREAAGALQAIRHELAAAQ
jgi:energy-coupling factor transporter ATP-binding protein EcfA2